MMAMIWISDSFNFFLGFFIGTAALLSVVGESGFLFVGEDFFAERTCKDRDGVVECVHAGAPSLETLPGVDGVDIEIFNMPLTVVHVLLQVSTLKPRLAHTDELNAARVSR